MVGQRLELGSFRVARQDERERHQPEGFPYLPRIQNLFNANQYGENFDISSLPGYSPVAVTGHCTSGLPIFNRTAGSNNTPSVSQDCSDYVVLRMNDITTLSRTSSTRTSRARSST